MLPLAKSLIEVSENIKMCSICGNIDSDDICGICKDDKRDKKIIVYKMRPKKKTRRKMGHRQELTRVMVKSITITSSTPKTSSKTEVKKKSTSQKASNPEN